LSRFSARRLLGRALTLVGVFVCASLLPTAAAHAEPFRLALGVDQGVLLPRRYAFDGLVLPGLNFGRLRVEAAAGAAFTNPKWDALVGLRPSFVVWAPVEPSTGVRVVADAGYLLRDSWRLAGGFEIDVDSARIGVMAGRDSLHRDAMILTTVAFDIPTIWRFFAARPFESAPTCGAP
jgi:hypothetical protein